MTGSMSLEWIAGAVIGWYISSNFLAGPVSNIASQLLGGLKTTTSQIGAPKPAATQTRGYGA